MKNPVNVLRRVRPKLTDVLECKHTLSKSSLILESSCIRAKVARTGSFSSAVSGSEVETRMKLLVETGSVKFL